MPVRSSRRLFVRSVLGSVAALVSAGCGTILYPERRGQPSGRLDWGIVALDGIGLLLFFVPGVIAFAVDFITGAIYLPYDGYGRIDGAASGLRRIDIPRSQLTPIGIAHAVSTATGHSITLEPDSYETRPLERLEAFWDARNELASATTEPRSLPVLRSQSPRR